MNSTEEKEQYFGSVRFFKNMILAVVIIAITIPTVISIVQKGKINRLTRELAQYTEKVEDPQSPAVLGLEVEAQDYQTLYPDFYAPQALSATESVEKSAFLTFDDGPSENTDIILDTLAEKGVKATFFVTGQTSNANLERMRRMVDEGHTIGMHTYSHNYEKIYLSVEEYLADMYQIFQLVKETTGVTPTCFRFPGGSVNSYNMRVYQEIIAEMLRRGFVPYDWNVSSGDASGIDYAPSQIVSNVLDGAEGKKRCFVLMHDTAEKDSTAAAVGEMIDGLQQLGFTLDKLTYQTKPTLFGYLE